MATRSKEKPKHLGRGLQSLLGPLNDTAEKISTDSLEGGVKSAFPEDSKVKNALRDIPLERIDANPYQPRTDWDYEELKDLAESIRVNGILQPVIVRAMGDKYQIVAGERRCRAAKIAELESVPALVRETSDNEMLELALVENIHRADLNPIERAKAYHRYIESFNLTQSQAAENLGENRSVVANHLRLLDLPKDIQQMLIEGDLSMGHCRAILSISSNELRRKLANRALAGRLSVRDVEKLVRDYNEGKPEQKKDVPEKPRNIIELEDRLKQELGTKVSIKTRNNGQKGKIVVEFNSLDDFDRIAGKMGVGNLI